MKLKLTMSWRRTLGAFTFAFLSLTLLAGAVCQSGCQSGHHTHHINSTDAMPLALTVNDAYSGDELWRKAIPIGYQMTLTIDDRIVYPMPFGIWVSDARRMHQLNWEIHGSGNASSQFLGEHGEYLFNGTEVLIRIETQNRSERSPPPDQPDQKSDGKSKPDPEPDPEPDLEPDPEPVPRSEDNSAETPNKNPK